MDNSINNWNLLKAGNKDGLGALYAEHIEDMIKYGSRFTKDDSLVSDAIQDLFIDLWRQRESISSTTNVKGYLLLSLRRKIIKELKKKSQFVSDYEPEDSQFEADAGFESVLIANEEEDEQISKLNMALGKLSDKQTEIIYLKYKTGMDNKEIADTLGINYQSVRNLLSRTIKVLRASFVWLFFLEIFF